MRGNGHRPWHFFPGEPLPCVSGQQKITTGKFDAVTWRVCYKLTAVAQPQPRQLLPCSCVAPHRTPALPGLGRDWECRCPMWFLMRRTKDHFWFTTAFCFSKFRGLCRFHFRRDGEKKSKWVTQLLIQASDPAAVLSGRRRVLSFLNKAMIIKTWQECVFIWESLSLLFLLATGIRCPFWNISLSLAGTALKHFSCEMRVESQRWMQLIILGEAVKIITRFHLYCLCHSNTPWARPFLYSTVRGRLWSFGAKTMTSLSW